MKTYFIADTHFGDDRIRRYENRPFATVDDMDEQLIKNWNEIVLDEDEVFLLGDCSSYGEEKTKQIFQRLHGRKNLIMGNHDLFEASFYEECGFIFVSPYPVLYEGFFLLSHEPVYVNENMPYANIFGHVHANPIYKDVSRQSFCVCVERNQYYPVEFDYIKQQIKKNTI